MTSYLLLRNNKESGPYSLDQLVSHGLKPYDLVWVTGKSAAWRYPGEITELQEFAPAVEEQPFDRFYKKPDTAKKEEPVMVKQPATVVTESPVFSPKKSVFVTMPGGQKQQPVIKKEQPAYSEYQQYQPSFKEDKEPVALTKTITITENPIAAEVKYSQPLDEIKEMYVKTLQERKSKIAYKAFLLQTGKKVAIILGIVGVGVLIGFTIKSSPGKKDVVANSTLPQTVIPQQQAVITATDPQLNQSIQEPLQNSTQPADQPEETEQRPLLNTEETKSSPVTKEKTISTPSQEDQPTEKTTKKNAVVNEPKQVPVDEPSPGVDINPSTGERARKVRSENEETSERTTTNSTPPVNQPKAVMRTSLSKLVSVKSNEYKKVAFGGIRDLELTVYNDSKYVLDQVTVELQYLKPSEEPLRTDNIQFRSVSPGGSLTLRIPDTNRGIKVTYKITNVLSTEFAKNDL
jgi:hypothetical protein